jgi:hypothetical protein
MRQMVKLRQIETNSQFHVDAMQSIERLQSYGCGIELVVDIFNHARRRGEYHLRAEWPRVKTVAQHTRDLARQIDAEEYEAINEFWFTKGNADITTLRSSSTSRGTNQGTSGSGTSSGTTAWSVITSISSATDRMVILRSLRRA